MIPQPFPPFPPSPFPPFLPSPFPPHAGLICVGFGVASSCVQILHSTHFVHQNALWCTNRFLFPVPYLRSPSRVPTVPLTPFRTSEAPPVYQPCPSPLSVPQKPLPCTNRVLHPVPYRRSPSRVPTVSLTPFRTAEAPPVYQPCPPSRSVPQKPLLCTYYAPHLVLCRESTFFEPNSTHYI